MSVPSEDQEAGQMQSDGQTSSQDTTKRATIGRHVTDYHLQDNPRGIMSHKNEVLMCAWHPTMDILTTASADSTAKIWDFRETEGSSDLQQYFESTTIVLPHEGIPLQEDHQVKDVSIVEWNRSGTLIATACYDGYARIWHPDGELQSLLASHVGPIFALKWNENYKILTAGVDRTTIVWNAIEGTQLQRIQLHTASILDLEWITADTFASCSKDKKIYVCKVGGDYEPIKILNGHTAEINCIRYDKASKKLASCSDDGTVKIWSLENKGELVFDWSIHPKEVHSVRWSPLGNVLASACYEKIIVLYDVRRGEAIRTLTRHTDTVFSVSFSFDGRYLASGGVGGSVLFWDVNTGTFIYGFIKNSSQINYVAWNKNGDKLAACASDGMMLMFDVSHIKNSIAGSGSSSNAESDFVI